MAIPIITCLTEQEGEKEEQLVALELFNFFSFFFLFCSVFSFVVVGNLETEGEAINQMWLFFFTGKKGIG